MQMNSSMHAELVYLGCKPIEWELFTVLTSNYSRILIVKKLFWNRNKTEMAKQRVEIKNDFSRLQSECSKISHKPKSVALDWQNRGACQKYGR